VTSGGLTIDCIWFNLSCLRGQRQEIEYGVRGLLNGFPASMLKAFLCSFFGLCSSVLIIFLSIRLSIDLFVLLSFSISKID